jgi:RNA polymerase-binding transcription factor DksA
MSNDIAARSAAAPLTGTQRVILRELLDTMWRHHVMQLTDLAVRYHADEDPDVALALAGVRRTLVDIESALDRLDSRSYGSCDGCDRRIPFEQLENRPATRYCHRCQPASAS